MTISLVSEIFTHEELKDGTAEAWINTQDPQNISSVMQTQAGNATVTLTLVFGEGIGIGEAYNTAINSLNVVENAPLDQQPLDETPLNAVTTAQTSTYTTVLDKQRLTVIVNVTSGTTGGTITLKTKNSAGIAINVPFIDTADDSINTSKVCTTGSYIFKLPADITIKELAVDLSSVTDGTFTVDILGGAL